MQCTSCDGVGHIHLKHFGFNYPVTCQLCQGDGLMKLCDVCGLNVANGTVGQIDTRNNTNKTLYVCAGCYYYRLKMKPAGQS